jgi:hypothetical protein
MLSIITAGIGGMAIFFRNNTDPLYVTMIPILGINTPAVDRLAVSAEFPEVEKCV